MPWKVAAVSGLSFARFNSTTSSTESRLPAESALNAAPETSDQLLSLQGTEIQDIPEKIGYLRELGLDYGWGPSSIMEWLIEHFHITSGLPWWGSIIAAGLFIRLALLKPSIDASDNGARVASIKHQVDPIRQRMMYHARNRNQREQMVAHAEIKDIQAAAGVSTWKSFVPMLQVPFGFGTYRVVNGMTSLPVPGLAIEEFGWIRDLTLADPFFILPVATSVVMYFTLKVCGIGLAHDLSDTSQKGASAGFSSLESSSLGKSFIYGLPALSFFFIAFFPSALQLYFASTGLMALGQAYLLNSPGFRRWKGMAPLPQRDVFPLPGGYSGSDGAQPNRALRMIQDAIETEKQKVAKDLAKAPPPQSVSFLDKIYSGVKENASNVRKEVEEKLNEVTGKGGDVNPDGTPAPPPRLSKKDKQHADEYHRRRQDEEDAIREERNHQRREAHWRALEEQREKAARAWKAKNKAKN